MEERAGRGGAFFFRIPLSSVSTRGEGTAGERLRFAIGLSANPVTRHFKETAHDSPSPWGEGRDEGERSSNFTRCKRV